MIAEWRSIPSCQSEIVRIVSDACAWLKDAMCAEFLTTDLLLVAALTGASLRVRGPVGGRGR
jgi:hypothetical protein